MTTALLFCLTFISFGITLGQNPCDKLEHYIPFERASSEFEFTSEVLGSGMFDSEVATQYLPTVAGDFTLHYDISDYGGSKDDLSVDVKHRFFQAVNSCVNSTEALLLVRFEDDTLNSLELDHYYFPGDINKCQKQYKHYCNILSSSHSYSEEFKYYSWWDDNAHIGFYTTIASDKVDPAQDIDIQYYRVTMKAQREVIQDNSERGYHYGGIAYYKLTLEYNDWMSTRSDNLRMMEKRTDR